MSTRTNDQNSKRTALRSALQNVSDAFATKVRLPERNITPRHEECAPYCVYVTHYFDTQAAYEEFINWMSVQFPKSLKEYHASILEARPSTDGDDQWWVSLEVGYAELIDVVIALQIIDDFRSTRGL